MAFQRLLELLRIIFYVVPSLAPVVRVPGTGEGLIPTDVEVSIYEGAALQSILVSDINDFLSIFSRRFS